LISLEKPKDLHKDTKLKQFICIVSLIFSMLKLLYSQGLLIPAQYISPLILLALKQISDLRSWICLFKDIISTSRKSKQDEPIVYKNRKVYPKIKTLQSLNLLLNKETVSFKCVDGYVKLTCEEIKELYDLVDQKIQSLFDLEMELYSKIDDFKVVSDFRSIEVDQ